MDRFLCQLCYSIVLYGERHPCFCYKDDDDDDDYTDLHLQESEEKGKKHDGILEESHNRNFAHSSGKIPENKVASPSKVISPTAKTNERTFSPASREKSQYQSLIAGNSDASSSEMFHDSSSFDATARIQECEVNLKESNCLPETTCFSKKLPDTESLSGKKELCEYNLSENIRFSTPVAVGRLSNNGNAAQSHEFMKNAALVRGPSRVRPQSATSALKRKHACDLCPMQFAKKGQLIYHYRSHTGERPFKCDFCGKGFTQTGNLVVHRRSHTGEKPYSCDICGKGFSVKVNLDVHFRSHTGEKPYTCGICGKEFSIQGNLVAHRRTHTGEKPYTCDICGKKFTQKSALTYHYGTHARETL